VAAQLLVQCLRESEDVCLGSRISCGIRQRLHRSGRGDIQDCAAATIDHRRYERGSERDRCLDQYADLLKLTLGVGFLERTIGREPSVVDEDLDV
jgi:hypothetical protein